MYFVLEFFQEAENFGSAAWHYCRNETWLVRLVVATHLPGRMMNKFVRRKRRSSIAQLWELAIFG